AEKAKKTNNKEHKDNQTEDKKQKETKVKEKEQKELKEKQGKEAGVKELTGKGKTGAAAVCLKALAQLIIPNHSVSQVNRDWSKDATTRAQLHETERKAMAAKNAKETSMAKEKEVAKDTEEKEKEKKPMILLDDLLAGVLDHNKRDNIGNSLLQETSRVINSVSLHCSSTQVR
ncbi:hypothetical protein BG015_002485, partial [Linnemannia schmuckeri]